MIQAIKHLFSKGDAVTRSKIYLIGYGGRTPEEIVNVVHKANGVLLDVRYSTRTRKKGFSKKALGERLSDDYAHFQEWGNENYNSEGGIKIADFDQGLKRLNAIMDEDWDIKRPIFLMCACSDGENCHRREVGQRLARHGYQVQEWVWDDNEPVR